MNCDYSWGFSPVHGHYIGYKLTLAIDYPSLKPLAILLHRGSPLDAPLFEEILEELKRRRIAHIGDLIVCDKGYYSCKNYVDGVLDFRIVPLIFLKKKILPEEPVEPVVISSLRFRPILYPGQNQFVQTAGEKIDR